MNYKLCHNKYMHHISSYIMDCLKLSTGSYMRYSNISKSSKNANKTVKFNKDVEEHFIGRCYMYILTVTFLSCYNYLSPDGSNVLVCSRNDCNHPRACISRCSATTVMSGSVVSPCVGRSSLM